MTDLLLKFILYFQREIRAIGHWFICLVNRYLLTTVALSVKKITSYGKLAGTHFVQFSFLAQDAVG